jgi:hypothetical protein
MLFYFLIWIPLSVHVQGVVKKTEHVHVHVLSSADVARQLMLIAKRDKWHFVVKTWR